MWCYCTSGYACLHDELTIGLHEQVSVRSVQVREQLERESDFDERCRQMIEAIAKCESTVEGNNDVPIEDLIVLLQTVSWFCSITYNVP